MRVKFTVGHGSFVGKVNRIRSHWVNDVLSILALLVIVGFFVYELLTVLYDEFIHFVHLVGWPLATLFLIVGMFIPIVLYHCRTVVLRMFNSLDVMLRRFFRFAINTAFQLSRLVCIVGALYTLPQWLDSFLTAPIGFKHNGVEQRLATISQTITFPALIVLLLTFVVREGWLPGREDNTQ